MLGTSKLLAASFTVLLLASMAAGPRVDAQTARNPIIHADVPDISIMRVDDTYYMSSTTMHMSPGLPIMKSKDLVNWSLASYAYDVLDDVDELNLNNGKHSYGRGSWASSLRYHDGVFYASTFSNTTGKTYIYSTRDVDHGPWQKRSFRPMLHDHTLFFDDDGKAYMLYGAGEIKIVELKDDLTGLQPDGVNQVVIRNASAPAGDNIMLRAEGSQLFKVNDKYYLFHITWPRGGMRTVVVHRADKITGPYEGRLALQDKGVAQGGLIDTPDGDWYAYLFQDHGSVGRIPYLVPVTWQDGWPVIGNDGKVPMELPLPASEGLIPGIVDSDEFTASESAKLSPVWQWNHNPDDSNWSLTARPGYLRTTTSRVDESVLSARNTLTQRTIGPECTGEIALDVSGLKPGDMAGLILLQSNYGLVGVEATDHGKQLVMINAETSKPEVVEQVPLEQSRVYLRAECDFRQQADLARFFYSLDGDTWHPIGNQLHMTYTLTHFMGYRFGLFNVATEEPGGQADFDYFRISNSRNSP
ncbi:glycoside hydrolase family 43 protein [Aeoliella mucimassa]|uniref:Beta-xylosidase n=1 Tax=Aeoliella mucimassa TaxID=2527972 RepID=A0A518AJS5_9BACT|nr:glycoside hydrolase 43 family protein [Aeoliella mucimassa]QDU54965.1 Beta-xylosidase [Aeoliella mucimassa]